MDGQFAIKRRLHDAHYIDCHSHNPSVAGVFALHSIDLSEYNRLIELPEFYSVGVHPWHIAAESNRQLLSLKNNSRLLAIGECGLDKAIDLPLVQQFPLFEQQIEMATNWHKPLIIHCVRAYNELLAIKATYHTGRAWLIHGCNTSYQQLQQLLAAGFYCSFGSSLMHPRSKPSQYLQDIPVDRWLLETDAHTQFGIDAIYSSAARILGWDVDVLHQQMVKNFERIFLND